MGRARIAVAGTRDLSMRLVRNGPTWKTVQSKSTTDALTVLSVICASRYYYCWWIICRYGVVGSVLEI